MPPGTRPDVATGIVRRHGEIRGGPRKATSGRYEGEQDRAEHVPDSLVGHFAVRPLDDYLAALIQNFPGIEESLGSGPAPERWSDNSLGFIATWSREQDAYLADFGIAKDLLTASAVGQTQPGVVVGSPTGVTFSGRSSRPRSPVGTCGAALKTMTISRRRSRTTG